MKTIQLKEALVIFALTLVVLISSASISLKADFSGDWILDQQKSNLGEMGARMTPIKMKVTQEGTMITIARTSTGQMGEVVTTDKLTFDGKESNSVGGREGSMRKAALKLADDQNTITVNSVTVMAFNGNSFEVNAKESWMLSADGKTLTIDSETKTQMGVTKTKLVYNRQ